MTFQFRFEFILDLRKRDRDEAGQKVGQATDAILKVDQQIHSLGVQRNELQLQQASLRVGSVSVDRMLSSGRYDVQIQADIQSLQQTRSKLVEELERRQMVLAETETEVKRFEQLREREQAKHQQLTLRREQQELDERSSTAYLLKQRGTFPATPVDVSTEGAN